MSPVRPRCTHVSASLRNRPCGTRHVTGLAYGAYGAAPGRRPRAGGGADRTVPTIKRVRVRLLRGCEGGGDGNRTRVQGFAGLKACLPPMGRSLPGSTPSPPTPPRRRSCWSPPTVTKTLRPRCRATSPTGAAIGGLALALALAGATSLTITAAAIGLVAVTIAGCWLASRPAGSLPSARRRDRPRGEPAGDLLAPAPGTPTTSRRTAPPPVRATSAACRRRSSRSVNSTSSATKT
jgi:hypothetical protein